MSGRYNGAINENGIEETLENLSHSTKRRLSGHPGSALDEKSFYGCREQARRVYYGAVFGVKKEIPVHELRE